MVGKADVQQWLEAGGEINHGLRLFSQMGGDPRLGRIVVAQPQYKNVLVAFLCDRVGLSVPADDPMPAASVAFREDWPFLAETDCPPELKILVADKISCYRRYRDAHARLFDCTTLSQCYATARDVVENYLENRLIFDELLYYKEHRSVLGRHPVFDRMKKLDRLRQMPIVELIRQKERLEHNLWRIHSEIERGDKPHLLSQRERRLREKQAQLAETGRMIERYEGSKEWK